MNSLKRGMVVVLFSLGLFGMSGCAEDNETEATKLAKGLGDPGKRNEAEKKVEPANLPPPRSQKEYYNRRSDPGKQMGKNYPGAENKRN